jgi:hypothetical protein
MMVPAFAKDMNYANNNSDQITNLQSTLIMSLALTPQKQFSAPICRMTYSVNAD